MDVNGDGVKVSVAPDLRMNRKDLLRVLIVFTLAALSFLLVETGVLATLLAIGGILAIATLVRVILTGEWSDTSWFGKLVQAIAKGLGGRPDEAE
ncbi:hypothetical protein ACFFTN_06755 [Aminobacter aganoensis]|uniref:Uncharacterized protein n=1 Tax=Aminobacter aganoensis TaxID=83264 RepID=A0A7X0FCM1_9HYPH|nr:hypothetical protein [Aminobacter aganoensis]MBB6357287.1 hypothetical protein [Aminobacter aganoensis]